MNNNFFYCKLFLCYLIVKKKGLSQAEEMLISRVMPLMSIYRLPHGQHGYKGQVINLPQDIITFAISLPRLPSSYEETRV